MGLFDGLKSIVTGAIPVLGIAEGGIELVESGAGIISGGQRSILSPCPGTPAGLAQAVALRLRDPSIEAGLRTFIATNPPPDKDFQQLRAVWGSIDGLASGAVWTAWGGGDCKTSSRETPLQNELRRIAALPVPGGGASTGTPSLSTTGTAQAGSGLAVAPLLIAGLAVVGIIILIRSGRR